MKNENLESQIKNQLDQRAIKPSAAAWEKLASALDEQEIGAPKKGRWNRYFLLMMFFLGIAVSYFMFKNAPTSTSETHHVTEVAEPAGFAQNAMEKAEPSSSKPEPEVTPSSQEIKKDKEDSQIASNQIIKNIQQKEIEISKTDIIKQTILPEKLEDQNSNAIADNDDISAKIKPNESAVANAELIGVEEVVIAIKLNKSKKIQVNTGKLLETALQEEKSSFFSKVVSKLNRKGQEAITLLSERNLEN